MGYVFTNDLSIVWRTAEGPDAGISGLNDPGSAALNVCSAA
jgi:hypothetical protein